MKTCTKCNLDKELNLFSKSCKTKDGKRQQCKDCDKLYRIVNKEKVNNYGKNYYIQNKEKALLYNKKYRIINSELISEKNKNNRDKNKIKIASREYYSKNKSILNEKHRIYQQENKEQLRDKSRLRNIDRRNNDPVFKLKCNIRRLIQLSFRSKGYEKKTKTFLILGCGIEFFKKYIEENFEEWMNWENRGLYNSEFNYGWDLDHIIPLKTAKTEEDVIRLNHYTNFQPLCSKINREIKNGKY